MRKSILPAGFNEAEARKRSESLAAISYSEHSVQTPITSADDLLDALVLSALPDGTFYARPSALMVMVSMSRLEPADELEVLRWREELLTRGEIAIELGIWNCYCQRPELMIRIVDLRRFQRFGSRRSIPKAVRRAVFERDGAECQECSSTENLSLDHIIPWSLNGPDTVENLRVLCRSCNSRKGARV